MEVLVKTPIAIVFAAALLAGCAPGQERSWWTLNEQNFARITPGKTTKDDLQREAGKPLMTTVFARQGEEVWDYRYLWGTYMYVAEVHFDMAGVARSYATYPDRCGMRAMPCR
jgi:outer membrane protein assembly factor BamE (lipoprotein component of BamABCDE complex)